MTARSLLPSGELAQILLALRDATDGGMGEAREAFALFRSPSSTEKILGVRPGADCDPRFPEPSRYHGAGYTQRISDALNRFPGKVTVNNVRSVDQFSHDGPVYDLQTVSSLYTANSAITSNCLCSLFPILIPVEQMPRMAA
jgi:hypothetical protein